MRRANDLGAAADIETLQVSSNADSIAFRLAVANRRELTPDDLVALVIDADADPTTGAELDDVIHARTLEEPRVLHVR